MRIPTRQQLLAASPPIDGWVRRHAPGRIEVLGKHTDYCGGRSLLCAVNRGISLAGRRLDEPVVRIDDLGLGQSVQLPLEGLQPRPGHWSNYPAIVLRRLMRNFPGSLGGAHIALASDLPPASGLSSSSALVCGLALLMADLYDLRRLDLWQEHLSTSEALANYLGCVENGQSFGPLTGDQGVGTFGGSQDHTAIICCQQGLISGYSFCPVRLEGTIAFSEEHMFIIGSCGVRAEKTGAAMERYNRLSLRAAALVGLWNEAHSQAKAATLNDVVTAAPDAVERLTFLAKQHPPAGFGSEELALRLEQFVEESTRIIPQAAAALQAGDWARLGALVDRSADLAASHLGNQIPQTLFLTRAARQLGAIAASPFGAGFGGAVWALVPRAQAEALMENWSNLYRKQFPQQARQSHFFTTPPSQGSR